MTETVWTNLFSFALGGMIVWGVFLINPLWLLLWKGQADAKADMLDYIRGL